MELEIEIMCGMVPIMIANFPNCKTIKIRYNYLISIIKFYVKVVYSCSVYFLAPLSLSFFDDGSFLISLYGATLFCPHDLDTFPFVPSFNILNPFILTILTMVKIRAGQITRPDPKIIGFRSDRIFNITRSDLISSTRSDRRNPIRSKNPIGFGY